MRYVHLTIILLNHFTKVGLLLVPQIILELNFPPFVPPKYWGVQTFSAVT